MTNTNSAGVWRRASEEPKELYVWFFCKIINKITGRRMRAVVYKPEVGWDLDNPFEVLEYLDESPQPDIKELVEALEEVLRISDRKHDAWDRAKQALLNHSQNKVKP